MDTPEFLVWAIEYRCPIRGEQDGSDPERTERQLRSARAVSEARRDGRVFEGLCIEPPDGFRVADALAVYGGVAAVEQACGGCPANAQRSSGGLAGCFGLLPVEPNAEQFHGAVDAAIQTVDYPRPYEELFFCTQPRGYGLWMDSPLGHSQQTFIVELLDHVDSAAANSSLRELQSGLKTALAAGLTVHAALYPAGRIDPPWWKLAPHCQRCKGPWSDTRSRLCAICGYLGHPAPDKKRHARGSRPYFPLERLFGVKQAAEFLRRYEEFRRG